MTKRDRSKLPPSLVHVVDMANMTTLSGLGEEFYKFSAVMFHPNDVGARRTFIASALRDMNYRLEDAQLIPKGLHVPALPRDVNLLNHESLLDAALPTALYPKAGRSENEEGGYTGTVIAATILARALAAAERGEAELGIAHIISDQGEEFRRLGMMSTGRDNMSKIWKEYRASAHISLAFYELSTRHRWLEDPRVLIDWASRSEDLLRAGSAIGNRFGGPILPEGECWSIALRPSLGG